MIGSYDVIVIGLGGVGSAAAAALAVEGYRVLGLDQFSPPHSRGSSHGETRVIRKAYFEHPDQGSYRAGSLIIAAGPWASECLREFNLPLQVIRKHVYWYHVPHGFYQAGQFPCFFIDTPQGFFYGIPQIGAAGLKIGRHSGGQSADPSQAAEHPSDDWDRHEVESFLKRCLPHVTGQMLKWSGCYYTMTPDQHFIVDRLPDCPQVTIVAGLSGHGFKFTPVLGELAACLATDRSSPLDIDFMSLSRFQAR